MAVGPGCDCDGVHGQKRSRSNHRCVRRRIIEAMMIRNRSPAKQRRYLSARVAVSTGILVDALPFSTSAGIPEMRRMSLRRAPHLRAAQCERCNRPLRRLILRGSISHSMHSLCTLRNRCRQRSRNTRYHAGAAPFVGRTSIGSIAPACLAHLYVGKAAF
jgi:hypothetical protein